MKNFLFQKLFPLVLENFYACNVLCINMLIDCDTCGIFWRFCFFRLLFVAENTDTGVRDPNW